MKKYILNFILICASITFTLICAELLLHFLPVSTGVGFLPVNAQQTIFHAKPNRDITYSKAWDFKLVINKHVNNAGFLNIHDYDRTSKTPLLAVVGDSFVEALQLNDSDPYFEQLQAAQNKLRVYSFGFSGAPLSQYLIWAQHAKQEYNNDYLIINVVGNDFDESLKKYKFGPGFYHYAQNSSGKLELERCDFPASMALNIARKSKLVAYLVRNVVISDGIKKIKGILKHHKPNYGNTTTSESDETYTNDSYQAIDAFFADLPQYSGLPAKNIAFVIDDRTTTYGTSSNAEELTESYFYKMKNYFTRQANALGYTVIDMEAPFRKHYMQNGMRFEFSFDGHWNTLGHTVVANTIQATDWWKNIIKEDTRY